MYMQHTLPTTRHYVFLAIIYVAIPLFLAWLGYGAYNFSHVQTFFRYGMAAQHHVIVGSKTLYDLPSMAVSMNTGGQGSGTVKVDLSIEVNPKDLERLQDFEPHIMERIALYMNKKNFNDMRGTSNMRVLREGLVEEIDHGALPITVTDVVIRKMVLE